MVNGGRGRGGGQERCGVSKGHTSLTWSKQQEKSLTSLPSCHAFATWNIITAGTSNQRIASSF